MHQSGLSVMDLSECLLPSYSELSSEQIKKINENSYLVRHKKGEQIFRQEQPVSHIMIIRSGLVKLYKEVDLEKSFILKISGPGNYIGIISVFYGNRYQHSATALEDTELMYTSLSSFKEIIGENGKYALHLLKQLSTEGIALVDKMINLSKKQIPGRIAEILLFFSREVYHSNSFTLPLSRQELADLVSSTKESISRTLTEFKNDRLIEINDRIVVLGSIELLEILSRMG
jgi:CRP/FNR family transcriptional regulator, polysaccharide utilization system transcription regulator